MSWNTSLINIADPNVTEGEFLSENGNLSTYLSYFFNQAEGWMIVGCTLYEQPATLPSGSGRLATIHFTALDNVQFLENSTLHLNETVLLLGDGKTKYNHSTEDGYCIVCLGDVDRGGDIDYDDFIVLAGAYGTSVGQPAYKPEADFDGDNNIDYDDFIILAGNYGKTC